MKTLCTLLCLTLLFSLSIQSIASTNIPPDNQETNVSGNLGWTWTKSPYMPLTVGSLVVCTLSLNTFEGLTRRGNHEGAVAHRKMALVSFIFGAVVNIPFFAKTAFQSWACQEDPASQARIN